MWEGGGRERDARLRVRQRGRKRVLLRYGRWVGYVAGAKRDRREHEDRGCGE
jgi:hypothetical protein